MTTYYINYVPNPNTDPYCTGVITEIEANNIVEAVNEILDRNGGCVKKILKITSHRQ